VPHVPQQGHRYAHLGRRAADHRDGGSRQIPD
jgi:hypothetical protein